MQFAQNSHPYGNKLAMIKITKHPLFLIGLVIRLIMLATVLPQSASSWYVPFLDMTTQHMTLDPWQSFLNQNGTNIAFPYGYAMWFSFLPLTLVSHLLHINTYFGYGLTLLLADLSLLFIFRSLFHTTNKLLLSAYWLSPIVLFATYWLGLNDIIPVALLCAGLYCLQKLKPISAGVFCSLAISAKLSMILAVPFFCIYLFRNRSMRHLLSAYLMGLTGTIALLGIPFALSHAAMSMLIHNPEMNKIYQLKLNIGDSITIYIQPMIYLLMLYLAWYVRRINFELFNLLFGLSFFLVVLLTPASPGWFIWVMPLLILYQARRGYIAAVLVAGFTALYIVTNFLSMPRPKLLGSDISNQIALTLNAWLGQQGTSFLSTILLTFGMILIFRIWREMIQSNDFFRLSRKPFIIGIAGDSGAGKDTLSSSLQGLFGHHSVITLSGDDYHLWDRQKPIWRAITHLNPQANDLERYTQDLIALADGKAIHSRHYNHESGKMTHPYRVESNDFIVASGLHALYQPILRNCYDLKIYLDIDEGLRRHFKLQRDVYSRGHSYEKVIQSLNEREEDSKKFIRPQSVHADLTFSLQPIHPRILENNESTKPLRLKLSVCSRRGLNEESLLRVLIGICGLHVDMKMSPDSNEVALTIEGETTADDIALAAKTLLPKIHEFLDILPRWEDGIRGLMQLIVLSHINQSLSERLI
jgi:uridine kinase